MVKKWKIIKSYNKKPNWKNATGRPSKLPKFIEAFEKVVNDDMNAIIHTDEDLFFITNDKLKEEDRIWYTTFKEYKNSKHKSDQEDYRKFWAVYKKALNKQKDNLFKSLKNDTKTWQKWAWIIERKFDDWNIRYKVDKTLKIKEVTEEEKDEVIDSLLDNL